MDNNSEQEHGQSDRTIYWLEQLEGKSREEVAGIIVSLEQRATRDELTGLINKEEFKKQFPGFVEGAFKRGSRVFVLFMDFDKLKLINDTEGHQKGNEYIKHGVEIMSSLLQKSDLLGRLHGDEFAAAIEFDNNLPETEPENVAQRLVTKLESNSISISFGIKEFKEGDDLTVILDNVDKYMRMDKTDRKAGREFNS